MTKNIKQDGIVFSEKEIAQIMIHFSKDKIEKLIKHKDEIRILEPSVGDGSLIVELISYLPSNINLNIDCLDIHQDFLKNTKNNIGLRNNVNINLINVDYLNYNPLHSYDIIISNPPYVRTSIIGAEKSQFLKKEYGLSGKVDLYHAFFIKMINELSTNGIISIITSNKYLYNKSGKKLREHIIKNLSLEYLLDLGDTKLFEASVLPSILIGEKNNIKKNRNKFISIYENHNDKSNKNVLPFKSIYEFLSSSEENHFIYNDKIFDVKRGNICLETNDILLLESDDKFFVDKVQNNSTLILKDLAYVKVGIKTTADKVFIHPLGFSDVEPELIHNIIISKSIQKWKVNRQKQKTIIYPYNFSIDKKEVINIDEYPKCKNFFYQNEEILKKRTYVMESSKEWFEIWVSHTPKTWKSKKLVFKDISSHGIFAYDDGSVVNGDSFFIVLKEDIDEDYLFYLLGILNSKLMYKYHQIMFPNKLYSNKNRFNSQYVEKYPIPEINTPLSKEIIKNVKKLIFEDVNVAHYEEVINNLCNELYGFNS